MYKIAVVAGGDSGEYEVSLKTADNVFNQLEPYLPMKGIKVRAYDIDTYSDYKRVLEITKDWMI